MYAYIVQGRVRGARERNARRVVYKEEFVGSIGMRESLDLALAVATHTGVIIVTCWNERQGLSKKTHTHT